MGSLATIRAIHDKANPFLPYYMNMFPTQKAEIVQYVEAVAPLSRVATVSLQPEYSHGQNEEILYKFLL